MTPERSVPSVVLPPLGVPAGALAPILPNLTARGPVALHDLPGQGLAAPSRHPTLAGLAAEVARTLDAAGFDRADVCGFGLGGMVALQLAIDYPGRVDRLVVACASAAPGNHEAYRARARAVRDAGLRGVAEQVISMWTTRQDPLVSPRLTALLLSCDAASYAAHCDLLAELDLADAMPAITAPTLALAAAQDRGLPPAHSRRLADALPTCSYHEIAGAAHLPWLEQPAAVCAAIGDHLSEPLQVAR
jgi:3-oxoadipate enol-lactonase/4-carboxymuconolactone decarboxylase